VRSGSGKRCWAALCHCPQRPPGSAQIGIVGPRTALCVQAIRVSHWRTFGGLSRGRGMKGLGGISVCASRAGALSSRAEARRGLRDRPTFSGEWQRRAQSAPATGSPFLAKGRRLPKTVQHPTARG